MGFIERKGDVKANVIENVKMITLEKHIIENVRFGTRIFTDEFHSYSRIGKVYDHKKVSHGRGEYVKGEAHTNSIEGFWAMFKRGHYGTYHYMSKKHLQRYVDEFVYRFNARLADFEDIFQDIVSKVSNTEKLGYSKLISRKYPLRNSHFRFFFKSRKISFNVDQLLYSGSFFPISLAI